MENISISIDQLRFFEDFKFEKENYCEDPFNAPESPVPLFDFLAYVIHDVPPREDFEPKIPTKLLSLEGNSYSYEEMKQHNEIYQLLYKTEPKENPNFEEIGKISTRFTIITIYQFLLNNQRAFLIDTIDGSSSSMFYNKEILY